MSAFDSALSLPDRFRLAVDHVRQSNKDSPESPSELERLEVSFSLSISLLISDPSDFSMYSFDFLVKCLLAYSTFADSFNVRLAVLV